MLFCLKTSLHEIKAQSVLKSKIDMDMLLCFSDFFYLYYFYFLFLFFSVVCVCKCVAGLGSPSRRRLGSVETAVSLGLAGPACQCCDREQGRWSGKQTAEFVNVVVAVQSS